MNAAVLAPVADVLAYYTEDRPDIQALLAVRGKTVLDVGCAAGAFGAALKRAGARSVIGIENVPAVASLAARHLDVVYTADIETFDPPIEPGSVDYIVFADVLEHTRDPWSVLARYRDLLAPGGRIVASLPNVRFYSVIARLLFNRWGYTPSGVLDHTHLRFFTLPTIRALFEENGLRITAVTHKYRLFEDQSRIGRVGALASRIFCRFVAPYAGRHFFTYQYIVIAEAPSA